MDTQKLIDRYEELSLIPGFKYTKELAEEGWQIMKQLYDQGYGRKLDHGNRKGWIWEKQETQQ